MTNNNVNRPDPAPADQDWFGGRRWTGIAAVGFIILIALCVVIVVVINRGGGHTTASGGSASASTTPGAATVLPGTGTTPTAALPTTPPTVAPSGTVWTIFQTVALPTVVGAGPTTVTHGGAVALGYAHSPLGALLAVVNEGQRYELAPDSQWRAAAAAMLISGPGSRAWVAARSKIDYGSAGAAGQNTLLQVAGFQFVSYTTASAVVQIVVGNPTSGYQVASENVTWTGSDWRFVPAANGGLAANLQQVSSLVGFIPWRGV